MSLAMICRPSTLVQTIDARPHNPVGRRLCADRAARRVVRALLDDGFGPLIGLDRDFNALEAHRRLMIRILV